MSRFFVHLHTPDGLERDEIGVNLGSLEEVYLDAFDAIGTISVELARNNKNLRLYSFEITDVNDQHLMHMPFSEYFDRFLRSTRQVIDEKLMRDCAILRLRCQKAQTEVRRMRDLCADLSNQKYNLEITITETRRLIAEARRLARTMRAITPPRM